MKIICCERCNASDWKVQDGYRICNYCGTKYLITQEDRAINQDVERLLLKCRTEPRNAIKYANLVLDIDPNNLEALKYLK